jgi:hypothetical protein
MRFISLFFAFLLLAWAAASAAPAETGQTLQSTAVANAPLLSPDHVYLLLVYAIIGSLGVLGLLLGLDKVFIMMFKGGAHADAFQKYSSESVARILPIIIEGITVILVVLTVIILGASRIISAEGTLGILGSIVGYVLGKSARKGSSASTQPKP